MTNNSKTTIYFKYGSMNSGKSLELIKVAYNYSENNIIPVVLKPSLDTRSVGFIYSRTGLKLKALEFDCTNILAFEELLNNLDLTSKVILIEESNFIIPEIIDLLVDFAYKNDIKSLMFFGLKNDFRGNLFEGSKRIIELADKIEESTSICWCGKKARQNARIVNGKITKDGETVLVDDDNTQVEYRVLCNYHYHMNDLGE